MSQVNLNYLSAAKVSGKDAESFLQAQLSADLTKTGPGQACFAAYCQPTGNVLAVLLVIKTDEGILLIAASELMDGLISQLERYILRADVRFQRLEHAVSGCPENCDVPEPVCVRALPTTMRYCISDSATDSVEPNALNQWREQELKAGIVWLNKATAGQFIPQMLGLEKLDGLSFRKGCFPGQEVIARVRYLGKLKRRPVVVQIKCDFALEAGTTLDLLGPDDLNASAVVVDCVTRDGISTLFLVARISEGSTLNSIQLECKRFELLTPVQT